MKQDRVIFSESMQDNSKCSGCPYEASCITAKPIEAVTKADGRHTATFRFKEIERRLFFAEDNGGQGEQQSELVGVDDIVYMLNRKGERHNRGYYLYTTIDAMRGIFKNKKLHLTRASEMNDQLEFVRFDKERWSRIYMACFSFETNESMGMWRMYGGEPDESVRLTIPRKELVDRLAFWRDNLSSAVFKAKRGEGGSFSYHPLGDVNAHLSLHDVIYQHKGQRGLGFIHYQGMYSGAKRASVFQDASKCHKLTSYVKDAIWEYEKEVRLVLEFDQKLEDDCCVLALDIDPLLEKMSVLLGPCDSKETRAMDILKTAKLDTKVEVKNSAAKVKFKTSRNK